MSHLAPSDQLALDAAGSSLSPPTPAARHAKLRDELAAHFAGTYTLERELGGGGMASVFVAEEAALGRKVVLKVLPSEKAGGVSARRFAREIWLSARLSHPHIVPLLSAGEAAGQPYYTMPLVEGQSLREQLAGGPLPIGEAVSVLRDVARALAYAHAHGVMHRDIKPENVLMIGGAAMVTDFGVAKAITAAATGQADPHAPSSTGLTSRGMALGTPAYMAPEQVAADPAVDHRADIFAWGVVAYELLAGRTPFAGRRAMAVMAANVNEVPEPIERLRPSAPKGLAALVTRALAKAPGDRPSADELLRALDALSAPRDGARAGSVTSETHPVVAEAAAPSTAPTAEPRAVAAAAVAPPAGSPRLLRVAAGLVVLLALLLAAVWMLRGG
jgi:eukaryotic-like serine/threonine-protein kinase